MLIKSVEIDGFCGHSRFRIELPDRGLVLVTGPNGSGKSAIIEAIADGFWGESLRDDRWSKPAFINVVAGELAVEREVSRSGKRTVLSSVGVFDTPRKTQDALTAAVGTFNEWRRTHVFSSADSSHFTQASDGERKELIELLLGADRFDSAADVISKQLAAKQADEAKLSAAEWRAAGALEASRATLAAARSEPDETAPPKPSTDLAMLQRAEASINEQLATTPVDGAIVASPHRDQLDTARGEARDLRTKLEQMEREAKDRAAGVCPTCKRPMPRVGVGQAPGETDRALIRDQLISAGSEVERLAKQVQDDERAGRERVQDAVRAHNELGSRLRDVRRSIDAHEAWEAAARGVAQRLAQRAERLAGMERAVCEQEFAADDAADACAAARTELKVLQVCREALGPRGARVHILSEALSGVQDVASAWLERFYDGAARCELRLDDASREKGQRAGSIALNIVGIGSGSYKSLSGGQRRRLDLSLQFALAEVAALASGRKPGTLWVDEAFDALDESGVAATQRALEDVARERCVVVISHSQHVVDGMRFDQHVQLGR